MSYSPLAETFQTLVQARPQFAPRLFTQLDDQPDWIPLSVLTADGTPQLEEIFSRVSKRYGACALRPAAALWFGNYIFGVESIVGGCWLAAQRVPDLSLETLYARFAPEGNLAGLAWCSPKFACLSDDPAAAHPDSMAYPSRDALRDLLRARLVTHFGAVIHAVSIRSPFGRAGMWALAADYCAEAFQWVGALLGQEQIGVAEVHRLEATPSKLYRQRDFIMVESSGLTFPLVDRVACCLYYYVEGVDYCDSCPLRPRAERVRLTQEMLDKRAAER